MSAKSYIEPITNTAPKPHRSSGDRWVLSSALLGGIAMQTAGWGIWWALIYSMSFWVLATAALQIFVWAKRRREAQAEAARDAGAAGVASG